MTTASRVQELALQLPRRSRLKLAERLLHSTAPDDGDDARAIVAEAERRDAELESGAVKGLTEEQFWSGVRRMHEVYALSGLDGPNQDRFAHA